MKSKFNRKEKIDFLNKELNEILILKKETIIAKSTKQENIKTKEILKTQKFYKEKECSNIEKENIEAVNIVSKTKSDDTKDEVNEEQYNQFKVTLMFLLLGVLLVLFPVITDAFLQ